MPLILTVENAEDLPKNARARVTLAEHGKLDIGRAASIDWTLPDPMRFVSGTHCEIRYRNATFWLYDVSTNGTFLNGSLDRIRAPHALRHGDRVAFGRLFISVEIEADRTALGPPVRGGGPFPWPRRLARRVHLEQIIC